MNRVTLIGRLGRDIELRHSASGAAVGLLSVCTDRSYKDKNGEWQKKSEWHRAVVYGERAEKAAEKLFKGGRVFVEGYLQTREWEDKSGIKRYTTEIIVESFMNLGDSKGGGNQGATQQQKPREQPRHQEASDASYEDDDIPF